MTKIIAVLVVVAVLLAPTFAYALTPEPDSAPDLTDISVFRNLLEPGDLLAIAKYNLPYASTPNATAAQSYLFRFMDTDAATELGSNEVHPFNEKGYGFGLIALYFPAASAPAWGSSYVLQIAQKPSEFASPTFWNFTIDAGDYSTANTVALMRIDLRNAVILIAEDLEIAWTDELTDTSDAGIILSPDGEIYFTRAIVGLRIMAPALFLLQIVDPDYSTENWTTSQADTYRTRYSGTWIGDAITTIANLFGMDFHYIASIPVVIIAILCVVAGAALGSVSAGTLGAVAAILYGALQGWTPFALIGIATIFAACFLAYIWYLRGAQ